MEEGRQAIQVNGRDGLLGWLYPDEQPKDGIEVLIRLEDGGTMRMPSDVLTIDGDSAYVPISRSQFLDKENTAGTQDGRRVIPVIVEELAVNKRPAMRGVVRIRKHVSEREETIEAGGFREIVEVERVPINRMVKEVPEPRQEGSTLIIPVLEEILVVEKRILLKEEVRVTRTRQDVSEPQVHTLRSESIEVERLEEDRPTTAPLYDDKEK